MSNPAPVLTLFNNKGGVGKTSLVYHLSWILSGLEWRILICDLDPQSNLTAAFLEEDVLEDLWQGDNASATIHGCIAPLMEVGDILAPTLQKITSSLYLLPGNISLSGFEDFLSSEWPNAMGSGNLFRSFRVLTAFWQAVQLGAQKIAADLILVDVGPNLGAINRSALIASDFVLVPLGADLFSLQGLRNLGPTLRRWRTDWGKRVDNWQDKKFPLPAGQMAPIGYVVQQHGERLTRPVKAYDRWINRIPDEYRRSILGEDAGPSGLRPAEDPHCLALLKHYRSLMALSQEARKPIFRLTAADGAIGAHAAAVQAAGKDFDILAHRVLLNMELERLGALTNLPRR